MTPAMKEMLGEIARGTDPSLITQVSQLMGGRRASTTARTLLALYKRGYLQLRKGGGMEISEKGRQAYEKMSHATR